MSNCIPCPPCEIEDPLTCEPYGAISIGNRILVEDNSFCTKTLISPTKNSKLIWDNGIKWTTDEELSGWKAISNTYYAQAGDKISANTSAISFGIFLPANPNQFSEIVFADHFNSWGGNNLTIYRNGSLIENINQDLICNTSWPIQFTIRYEGVTWRVYEA